MYNAAQKSSSAKHIRAISAASLGTEDKDESGAGATIKNKIENIDRILAEGPKTIANHRSMSVELPGASFFAEDRGASLDERPLPLSELQRKTESRMKERKVGEAANNRKKGKLTL